MPPPDFTDLDSVAAALAAACPDAGPIAPLHLLGTGGFSRAVETAGGLVFRLALSPDVVARHDKEMSVLPALQDRLPLPIPNPHWRVAPSTDFPYGAIGYRKLPGQPMFLEVLDRASDRPRIVADLAGFLLAIHRFSVDEAQALGVPGPVDRPILQQEIMSRALPALRLVLPPSEYSLVLRWWQGCPGDVRMRRFTAVFTHGDPTEENILVDDAVSRITAVIDFEHCAVDDPMLDFAQVRRLGDDFLAEVLHDYRELGGEIDAGFRHRLERHWQFDPFFGIYRAAVRDDPELLVRSVDGLRARGILPSPA